MKLQPRFDSATLPACISVAQGSGIKVLEEWPSG